MYQPSRRSFLGVVAGLAGTAGCLGDRGGTSEPTPTSTEQTASGTTTAETTNDPDEGTPTTAGLGTELTVNGVSVTVSNLTVQGSVLYLDSPDSMAVATRDGERYALVSVTGSESGPPPGAFALVVDGERYPGRVEDVGIGINVRDRGAKYDPSFGTARGWVAFVVPAALDASEGRIVLEDGSESVAWRLSEEYLGPLRRPKARFELREVEIPESVSADERVSVRVAAENVSDVGGTFRGVLNVANLQYAYAPYPFALDAAPGETVAWERTFEETPPEGVGSVGFFLDTVAGGTETQAAVIDGTTTGSGPSAGTTDE